MGVLPETVIEQIEFCEAHWPVWNVAPAAVGLLAPAVAALKTATETARSSYNAAQTARQASKAATITQNSNAALMRGQVADLIRQIKAFAELQANPNTVYAAAQIPAPTPPTPLPAPGKPTNFETILEPDGSVTLSWDAANSAASTGTFFTVSRKLPGQTSFVGVGGAPGSTTESRRAFFTDATVPASAAAAGAQYIVQGFRGTRTGEPSDAITVQFGLGEGATFTSVRLAA
jgi:hypothetical protein